jgi:GNAT superfamily N-acetyltransferase
MTSGKPQPQLRMVITYLEMNARPTAPTIPVPRRTALLRAERPTISFYRYLYNTVGERWLWYERRAMDDETLSGFIHDPGTEIYVLYSGGVPAGYAELNRRVKDEIELAYFGLMPEFIGQGLGRYFLSWAVDCAWTHGPERVWVSTNNFDHPRAIQSYQRAGFAPYRQETLVFDDPRASGLIPAHIPVPETALA